MNPYHKIQTVFKRDPKNNHKTLLLDRFALPEFEYLKDNLWEFTEKVDGTNIRVMWNGSLRWFGGKTDNANLQATLVKVLEDMFPPEKFAGIPEFASQEGEPADVCLYGEGFGPKIQKGGGNYGEKQSFVLFDVKVGPWWLKQEAVEDVAKRLEILTVPVVGHGTLADLVAMVSSGFLSEWGEFMAEGIVARPATPLFDRRGHRIITKLKYKDFPR